MKKLPFVFGGLVAVIAGAVVWMETHQGYLPVDPKAATPPNPTTQILLRGEYLARAGDCVACHTEPTGKLFAGGRPMATPFGAIYVPNITPDDETGIGRWTSDDFYRQVMEIPEPQGAGLGARFHTQSQFRELRCRGRAIEARDFDAVV